MKSFQFKIDDKTKGITLIETLVAIFVLITGIVGAFSLIISVMSFTSYNSNKLIASYLAQEGVELVRNIRDINWWQNNDWDIYDGLNINRDSEIDYNDDSLINSTDRYLKIDANGYYNYDSGGDTNFKRNISVSNIDPVTGNTLPDSVLVTITVSWEEKGNTYYVQVVEHLYNWY